MPKKSTLAKGFDLPMPAQRTAVPETAARKFERPPQKAVHSKKRGAETGVSIVAYLPPDIEKALRLKCFHDGRSVSNAATEAFRAWLELDG